MQIISWFDLLLLKIKSELCTGTLFWGYFLGSKTASHGPDFLIWYGCPFHATACGWNGHPQPRHLSIKCHLGWKWNGHGYHGYVICQFSCSFAECAWWSEPQLSVLMVLACKKQIWEGRMWGYMYIILATLAAFRLIVRGLFWELFCRYGNVFWGYNATFSYRGRTV